MPKRSWPVAVAVAFTVLIAPFPLRAQDNLAQARELFYRGRIDSALALIRREADTRRDHAETQYWLGRIAGEKAHRVRPR